MELSGRYPLPWDDDAFCVVDHDNAGETRHFSFAAGEFLLHDIENVGTEELVFTTVEHLDSANPALPLG